MTEQKKKTVLSIDKFSNFKKHIEAVYKNKYQFPQGRYKVTITRLFKKPGIQTNLLDLISEIELNQSIG